ncbi:MAG: hypothetical protein U0234_17975 [Sandaracinus sp.]
MPNEIDALPDPLPDDEQEHARGLWECADGDAAMAEYARAGLLVSARKSGPNVLIELDQQVFLPDRISTEDCVMLARQCPVRADDGWWMALWGERLVRIKIDDWEPARRPDRSRP